MAHIRSNISHRDLKLALVAAVGAVFARSNISHRDLKLINN